MTTKPRLLSQSLLARTQVFRVEQLELEFANGVRRCYERIDGGEQPAVMVIPVLDPDTLLLVREYAAGTQRYELGFPKGRMEPGEDALACAQREIREEIGYGARDLRLLRTLDLAPRYIRHGTHLVLARDLYPDPLPGDEPEPLQQVQWPLARLDELLAGPECNDCRSLLAALLTVRFLQGEARPWV